MKHNITRPLEQCGLSAYILTGFKRKRLETVEELKKFVHTDECFKETGVLGISGLGIGATRELLHKIPEVLELCQSLECFDMDKVTGTK